MTSVLISTCTKETCGGNTGIVRTINMLPCFHAKMTLMRFLNGAGMVYKKPAR